MYGNGSRSRCRRKLTDSNSCSQQFHHPNRSAKGDGWMAWLVVIFDGRNLGGGIRARAGGGALLLSAIRFKYVTWMRALCIGNFLPVHLSFCHSYCLSIPDGLCLKSNGRGMAPRWNGDVGDGNALNPPIFIPAQIHKRMRVSRHWAFSQCGNFRMWTVVWFLLFDTSKLAQMRIASLKTKKKKKYVKHSDRTPDSYSRTVWQQTFLIRIYNIILILNLSVQTFMP